MMIQMQGVGILKELRVAAHSGKERSTPPAVPRWFRSVKLVRIPRFRRAMQMPLKLPGRPLLSGTACNKACRQCMQIADTIQSSNGA